MEPSAHSVLSQWESFYVIVGSSAGGLTGLWFVVVTLVADSSLPRTAESTNAFGTPNVAHFAAVLVLSAILSAPWVRLKDPAHLIGLMALAGVVYVMIVTRRMLRQAGYKPVLFLVGGVALLQLCIGIHNAWDTITYIVAERRKEEGEPK